MRRPLALVPLVLPLILATAHRPAGADAIELVAADDRGVTLRFTLPVYRLEAREDGRSEIVAPGLQVLDQPGRPQLPFASTLIALPPGAEASARVVSGSAEESKSGVKLTIGSNAVFQQQPGASDFVPARVAATPIADGPWPREAIEIGRPFTVRHQRVVAVSVRPFRADDALAQLWVRHDLTVRIDFSGSTPVRGIGATEDRHWDSVLREAVLNHDQGRSWREPPRTASRRGARSSSLFGTRLGASAVPGAGFDEDSPEVRVKVDTTGLYELNYGTLKDFGFPAGVPIRRVSVHRHEFVENQVPAYVTIELPGYVEDRNGNGIFDQDDGIVVLIQNWAQRSGASVAQRAWGDGEVVYATVAADTGLRMPSRPAWRGTSGLTPLASYPWHQRWERNFFYQNFPNDTLSDQFHWTEFTHYFDREDSLRFETNDLDPTQQVNFSLTWQGLKDTPHVTWAQVSTDGATWISVADSVVWGNRGALTVSKNLPGSTFGEGNVNHVRTWGRSDFGPPDPSANLLDYVGLNYFEATYWRRYRALNDFLPCNSADATGEIQIDTGGFSDSDLRAYDVSDPLHPVRLVVDPSHVRPVGSEFALEFQDSVAARHDYVVCRYATFPPVQSFSAVTRRRLAERTGGDYLLVVPEAFLPAVGDLVTLRQQQGLDVAVSPLESIQDEFNGGRKSSYAIKRYVQYAFENWNAKFVLLLGDGSEDPLNLLQESSTDWVPVQKINGPVFISFGYEIVPCDPWYVCLNNSDINSGLPVIPDLFIGRLPVQSLQQAKDVIAKLKAYESFSADQTWRSVLLLSSDDEYSAESFFGGGIGSACPEYCHKMGERVFRLLNETVGSLVTQTAGLSQMTIDAFNLGYFLRNEPSNYDPACADTCRPDRLDTQSRTHATVTPDLLARLAAGRLWWNFQGHANESVLTHEDLYVDRGFTDDKESLANDGKPFLFSAFSCHANAFAHVADNQISRGPSIGEDLVNLPNRGAIASFASTGYEILPGSGSSHINVAWADAMFNRPPRDEYLGDRGSRVVLGETIALAMARYVPTVQFNAYERGIALTYHLLGDPATRLSIGAPEAAVTANALPVTSGVPIRLHTLGDTLRLEGDLASNTRLTALSLERTDAAGTVVIPPASYTLSPAFPDTESTGSGGRRFHLTYRTTLEPESFRYTFRTTDRYGVAGAFDAAFEFRTQLRLDGNVLADNDEVPPAANLSLQVLSPKPLDPATELTLTVDGAAQPFSADPAPGDPSGREWILSWSHPPYTVAPHEVRLVATGGATGIHPFRVSTSLHVQNVVAFPNPFDDQLGTVFSFTLASVGPADMLVRVYTASGRMVYQRVDKGLAPGYHQLRWDGRDAEGQKLANGVYVYKMMVTNGNEKVEHQASLVKLRKPRRDDTGTTP